MPCQRRTFLKTATTAAVSARLFSARPLFAGGGSLPVPIPELDDARLKALVHAALDAAKSAGAQYTDVRMTHSFQRGLTANIEYGVTDTEELSVGVRTLVNGHWGFASSPIWSTQEMVRLAQSATAIAQANASYASRVVDFTPVTLVQDGRWTTPISIDPFDVPPMEILDFFKGFKDRAERTVGVDLGQVTGTFNKQDRIFGSSDGSYCSQRLYQSQGSFEVTVTVAKKQTSLQADFLAATGVGLELFWGRDLLEDVRQMKEAALRDLALPVLPVEIGRYVTVCDGASMGALASATIGPAVEIDRALGYEANGVGTSYLNDPLAMVGTLQVAAPIVSISANRNETGGASTVRWDDEGVEAISFPLVTQGQLTDFQAMREGGGWLKESDARLHRATRSRGCATSSTAIDAPVTGAANLTMAPGPGAPDLDGLAAGIEAGLLIRGAAVQADFQCLNGVLTGVAYQIRNGKRVARVKDVGVLFRAPELWKGITALGGEASLQRRAQTVSKGEPRQTLVYSVTAPAAIIKETTVIDIRRRA